MRGGELPGGANKECSALVGFLGGEGGVNSVAICVLVWLATDGGDGGGPNKECNPTGGEGFGLGAGGEPPNRLASGFVTVGLGRKGGRVVPGLS